MVEPLDELKKRESRDAGIKMYQQYIDQVTKEDTAKGQKGKIGAKSVKTETNTPIVDPEFFKANTHHPKVGA